MDEPDRSRRCSPPMRLVHRDEGAGLPLSLRAGDGGASFEREPNGDKGNGVGVRADGEEGRSAKSMTVALPASPPPAPLPGPPALETPRAPAPSGETGSTVALAAGTAEFAAVPAPMVASRACCACWVCSVWTSLSAAPRSTVWRSCWSEGWCAWRALEVDAEGKEAAEEETAADDASDSVEGYDGG